MVEINAYGEPVTPPDQRRLCMDRGCKWPDTGDGADCCFNDINRCAVDADEFVMVRQWEECPYMAWLSQHEDLDQPQTQGEAMPKLPTKGEPDLPDTSVENDDPLEQQAEPAPAKKAAAKKAPVKKAAAKKAAAPTVPADPKPKADLLGSARSLDEVTDFLSIGYYGKGGSGKTTDLASMVNICDGLVIFINAEAGLKRRALESHGLDTSRILVLPDPEQGQVLSFDFIEEVYFQAKDRLQKEPGSIGGFCFDSLPEIYEHLMRQQLAAEITKAERLGRERDRWHKEQGDWGKVNDQMAVLLRRFRDLPCHFGWAALERRDTDDDGKVIYNPSVTPGLQNPAIGIPDIVIHTFVDEVGDQEQYVGASRALGKYEGKDRYRVLPSRLIDPTFSRVHAYVNGALTVAEDAVQQAAVAARKAATKNNAPVEPDEEGDDTE